MHVDVGAGLEGGELARDGHQIEPGHVCGGLPLAGDLHPQRGPPSFRGRLGHLRQVDRHLLDGGDHGLGRRSPPGLGLDGFSQLRQRGVVVAPHRDPAARIRFAGQHGPDDGAVGVGGLREEDDCAGRAAVAGVGSQHKAVAAPVGDGHVHVCIPCRALAVAGNAYAVGGREAMPAQRVDDEVAGGAHHHAAQAEGPAGLQRVKRRRLAVGVGARPHQAVALDSRERAVADGASGRVGGMGGNVGAPRGAAGVAPAVVAADQLPPVVGADGEPHPPVQAAVLPHVHETVVGPPHRQLPAQQPPPEHMAAHHVLEGRHRMPQTLGVCAHARTLPAAGITP